MQVSRGIRLLPASIHIPQSRAAYVCSRYVHSTSLKAQEQKRPMATAAGEEPPAKTLQELSEGPGAAWKLLDGPKRLEQSFKFKDFASAWAFMGDVAQKCEEKNHHPEWSNVYNQVFVRWTTHRPPGGVRKKDREMATFCEEAARRYGAELVGVDGDANTQEGMGGLVEGAGGARCDCGNGHGSAATGGSASSAKV